MSSENNLRQQIIQKAWEDEAFKKQLLADPRAAIKEAFQVEVPEGVEVNAVEEQPNSYYLVIPVSPADSSNPAVAAPPWK
ncbi:NHLP leader peptide domain-containing protein [Paenibacillus algorifonticola]|uniref:NHLP leader peptide domain-containing protein n=1 Tax=Paenibacillus algorifonticola TaxID=684063 RepID=A0A1I2F0B3_9BACL|nr:NHLP leader peptide family RiPP precursor [Paenibacillus algorifonticola]SFE97971.1 NHLP leader peptide domain-containing protein [Paenibacillus algorifonticola]